MFRDGGIIVMKAAGLAVAVFGVLSLTGCETAQTRDLGNVLGAVIDGANEMLLASQKAFDKKQTPVANDNVEKNPPEDASYSAGTNNLDRANHSKDVCSTLENDPTVKTYITKVRSIYDLIGLYSQGELKSEPVQRLFSESDIRPPQGVPMERHAQFRLGSYDSWTLFDTEDHLLWEWNLDVLSPYKGMDSSAREYSERLGQFLDNNLDYCAYQFKNSDLSLMFLSGGQGIVDLERGYQKIESQFPEPKRQINKDGVVVEVLPDFNWANVRFPDKVFKQPLGAYDSLKHIRGNLVSSDPNSDGGGGGVDRHLWRDSYPILPATILLGGEKVAAEVGREVFRRLDDLQAKLQADRQRIASEESEKEVLRVAKERERIQREQEFLAIGEPWRIQAEGGEPNAQYEMGNAYAKHLSALDRFDQDTAQQVLLWYGLAARNGHKEASKRLQPTATDIVCQMFQGRSEMDDGLLFTFVLGGAIRASDVEKIQKEQHEFQCNCLAEEAFSQVPKSQHADLALFFADERGRISKETNEQISLAIGSAGAICSRRFEPFFERLLQRYMQ